MSAFAKIKAGRVNSLDFTQYVGEEGHLFYNVVTGELRISDGHTVGGNPIVITATTVNTTSIIPELDDVYGLGDADYRWNHVHIGSGGLYLDGDAGTNGCILRVDTDHTLTFDNGTGNLAVGGIIFPDNSRQTRAFMPNAMPHDLLPAVSNIYDLGSATQRWANIWVGPNSLHLLDQTRLTDVAITVDDGTLFLNGAQNLVVGNLTILDTTLTSSNPTLDISIGDTGDTGIFRIKRKTAVTNNTFSDTESAFIINANGQEPVTLFPDTLLTTVGRPNKNSRIVQRAYGADPTNSAINAYPVWASYVARGNVAVPEPTQSGDILMRLSANGRGTTGWGAGGARVEVVALETFTNVAKGTQINFWTTPIGSSTTVNTASVKSSGFTGNAFTFTTDGTTQSTAAIPMTYRGNLQANKVATLAIDGRLDTSQIPTSLTGALVFQGGWDAANNYPVLSDSTGTTGWQYIVTIGGTANLGVRSETYVSGDAVTYGGGVWNRTTGSSPFTSLTGGGHITVDNPTGAMTLGSDATPNYTSGTIVSRDSNGNFAANLITATLAGSASSAATAGTVTNPVQTTITRVGTLGNLIVSGNITSTYISGQLTTGAQPGIISLGNLSNLTVTGLITAKDSVSVAASLTATTVYGNIIANGTGRFGSAYAGYNYPGAVVQIFDNKAGYSQLINMNYSSDISASTDFVAQNNLGADALHYVDLGINSSNYDGTSIGWTISGANDSYLYANAGSLTIGTDTAGKIIKFHTSGVAASNIRANITDAGMNVMGNVTANYYLGSGIYLTGIAKSSDIAGANAAISSLTGSIAGANAAISTINGNVAGANAAISSLTGSIAGANAVISSHTNSISNLNGNVAGANAAIGVLTGSIAGANAAISTINSNVAGANAAIGVLTGSIAGANAAISVLTGSIAGANAVISSHTTSISNLNGNVAGANAAIGVLQSQVYANANVAAYLASFTGSIQASNITATGSISDVNGNVRNLPIVNKITGYTLQTSDAGNLVSISSGNVTVPSSVFISPYGQAVSIFNNNSVATNIIQATSVTLRLAGTATTGNRTLARYGIASIVCVAANTFVISGAGLT